MQSHRQPSARRRHPQDQSSLLHFVLCYQTRARQLTLNFYLALTLLLEAPSPQGILLTLPVPSSQRVLHLL